MSTYDEGHTVAGWTGTAIATVGSCVIGLGICMTSIPVVAGGTAIAVVALLVTWALHLTGWGKPPGVRPRGDWGMGVRDRSARAGHTECWQCRLAGRGQREGSTAVVAGVDAGLAGGAAGGAEVVPERV